MSIAMPAPDQRIIARGPQIVAALRAVLPPDAVIDDPQETRNLAGRAPKVFNELSAALRRHIQRGGAVPWQKP